VACVFHHQADQRRGGRLARAAGDADDRGRAALQKELRAIAPWNATRDRRLHDRQLERHAARQAQQVHAIEKAFDIAAEHELYARIVVGIELELLGGLAVGGDDRCASGWKPARQCLTLPRQPDDANAFASEWVLRHPATTSGLFVAPRLHAAMIIFTKRAGHGMCMLTSSSAIEP